MYSTIESAMYLLEQTNSMVPVIDSMLPDVIAFALVSERALVVQSGTAFPDDMLNATDF